MKVRFWCGNFLLTKHQESKELFQFHFFFPLLIYFLKEKHQLKRIEYTQEEIETQDRGMG